MSIDLVKVRRVLQNKRLVEQIILARAAEKDEVIYGARAINAQVPDYLEKHTEDYDVYSKYPSKAAKGTAKELNDRFGDKIFYAKKGKNETTWKVKSKIDKSTVVDYTRPTKTIPTVNKMGVRYASIEHLKKKIKSQIRSPDKKFRRLKDKSALTRINAFEEKWRAGEW